MALPAISDAIPDIHRQFLPNIQLSPSSPSIPGFVGTNYISTPEGLRRLDFTSPTINQHKTLNNCNNTNGPEENKTGIEEICTLPSVPDANITLTKSNSKLSSSLTSSFVPVVSSFSQSESDFSVVGKVSPKKGNKKRKREELTNVPTVMVDSRIRHNLAEQNRRNQMRESFDRLKGVIPNGTRKLTKVALLNETCEYIQNLHEMSRQLLDQNTRIRESLLYMQRTRNSTTATNVETEFRPPQELAIICNQGGQATERTERPLKKRYLVQAGAQIQADRTYPLHNEIGLFG